MKELILKISAQEPKEFAVSCWNTFCAGRLSGKR